jgi:hypothetical protein
VEFESKKKTHQNEEKDMKNIKEKIKELRR